MVAMILLLITTTLTGAQWYIERFMTDLVDVALFVEKYIGGVVITQLYDVGISVGLSLLVLKILKKGFETYVLWTDGDPDTEPEAIVVRFIEAIALALSFPLLYDLGCSIVKELSDMLVQTITSSVAFDWQGFILGCVARGLVSALAALGLIICYVILYFKFLMRGCELLILRIGFPIACIGLLDSDKGIFRTYINKFIQAMFATILQLMCMKLGFAVMTTSIDLTIFGIAIMILAIKIPDLLRDIIPVSGSGGGIINKIYSTTQIANSVSKLMGK